MSLVVNTTISEVQLPTGSTPEAPKVAGQQTGLSYRIGESVEELLEAWHLVYRAYRRAELIDSHPAKLHTVPEALGDRTAVVIGRIGPVCASTLTAHGDGARGLALDEVYGEELSQLRAAGRRLCEVGLFGDRRHHLYRSADSLFELMRYVFHFACHRPADDIVIGVHPRHAPFYRRLIGFRPAGPERSYEKVKDHPVVLLRLDLHAAPRQRRLPRGLKYFLENPIPAETYAQRARLTPEIVSSTALAAFDKRN